MESAASDGDMAQPRKRRDFALGLVLLACVVLLWVSSGFLMSSIFRDQAFGSPWLITYICTASFSVYLIRPSIAFLLDRRRGNARSGKGAKPDDSPLSRSEYQRLPPEDDLRSDAARTTATPPLTTEQTARLAAEFVALWFLANWSVNAALQYTSVSSTTIMSSMSGFFMLGIGAAFGVEKFDLQRLGVVVMSVIGVVLVSNSDQKVGEDETAGKPLLGDVLALISAGLYAFYVLLMKVRVRDESRIDMQMFFGFVGVINTLAVWPVGVVLHYTGIEPFHLPHTRKVWFLVVINACITVVSDYLYMLAMLKTSPLIVTLGLSLTLPLAVLGDLVKGEAVGVAALLGGALVLGSFVLLSYLQRESSPA